jgi:hypothetical protein
MLTILLTSRQGMKRGQKEKGAELVAVSSSDPFPMVTPLLRFIPGGAWPDKSLPFLHGWSSS